ncbi:hypothetical protein KR49_00150 [Synechococcus sp. KORDI-49]|nr:hypothetical protein KR49_00150 [Synechococcus sp. KORDI-49]
MQFMAIVWFCLSRLTLRRSNFTALNLQQKIHQVSLLNANLNFLFQIAMIRPLPF